MHFIPFGDEVLAKAQKRQRELDRLPAEVRARMTPEEELAYRYQDVSPGGLDRLEDQPGGAEQLEPFSGTFVPSSVNPVIVVAVYVMGLALCIVLIAAVTNF